MITSVHESNNIVINGTPASVMSAMRNSLYPGAKEESIMMLLEYCRAAQIDPMLKPAHIVPMTVKDPKTGNYLERDVIMPGIGLYRIQAERSGAYAGIEEAIYGPDITEDVGGKTITYPEWCSITVNKIVQGQICPFNSGKKFWKANFSHNKSGIPTPIWAKRPHEQLAKCAEAEALRKAFPGIISQGPTAEEMEGKAFLPNQNHATEAPKLNTGDAIKEKLKSRVPMELKEEIAIEAPKPNSLEDIIEEILILIERTGSTEEQVRKWLDKAGVKELAELPYEKATQMIEFLLKKLQ